MRITMYTDRGNKVVVSLLFFPTILFYFVKTYFIDGFEFQLNTNSIAGNILAIIENDDELAENAVVDLTGLTAGDILFLE